MAPRRWNRLSARSVAAATKPGMYADGAGLYLRVARSGARSWSLRFMLEGRALGLALIDWIGLIDEQQPMFGRRPARIGEGQVGEPA